MSTERYTDVDYGTDHIDVFTNDQRPDGRVGVVRIEARQERPKPREVHIDLDTAAITRLHRQLGEWLGAPSQGILNPCPGSGQPPATWVPKQRQGTCSQCGDRMSITRHGVVYKHRARPL